MDNIDGLIGRLPQFRILWVKALCCNYPEISEPTLILETGLSNRRPPHYVMLKKSIDLNSLVICDFLNPWLFLQPDIPSRCDETWVMRDYEAMHRAIEMQMKRICLRNFSATFVYTICWMCLIYLIHFTRHHSEMCLVYQQIVILISIDETTDKLLIWESSKPWEWVNPFHAISVPIYT